MRGISRKGVAAAAIVGAGLALSLTTGAPAVADPAGGSNDVVGVGSDTLQYMLDFGADGDFNGNPGYNAGKLSRIVNFDATPDANARAGYLNGSTSSSLKSLNPTIVLRAGQSPVQRPNGSGAGINALSFDLAGNISYARSSSPLSQSQVNAATGTGGVGNLHEIRLAKDGIHIAVGKTTNAVPLSNAQLKQIYQCNSGFTHWSDAGVGGSSADTIIPIIPQNGSGTRKTFLQDIGFTVNSDGSTTPALGSCVKTYEENDPYALYVDASGNQVPDPYANSANPNPDALEPISDGRLALYADGYFTNPNLPYGTTSSATDQVVLKPQVKEITTGTPSDNGALYEDIRGLYVIFREADITSNVHFNGSAKNWVQTLFLVPSGTSGTPFFKGAAGAALLASAGVTPDYADCGMNPTTASACGPL
jgi:hypothetical protein